VMTSCFVAHVLVFFLILSMLVVGSAIIFVCLMLDMVFFGILSIFLMLQNSGSDGVAWCGS